MSPPSASLLVTLLMTAVTAAGACRQEQRTSGGARSSSAGFVCAEPGALYHVETNTPCLASRLPWISHEQWSPEQIESLVAHSLLGVVAVKGDGKERALVPGCSLLGEYVEPAGDEGAGRLWFANPVAQPLDAMGPGCEEATHLVAAFALRLRPRGAQSPYEFRASLFPLPCPSVASAEPARGCLGRGSSGVQRLARARELLAQLVQLPATEEGGNVAERLRLTAEIAALAPDDEGTLAALREHPARLGPDCLLAEQLSWLLDRHRDPSAPLPGFYHQDRQRLAPFLSCFPDLFVPSRWSTWQRCSCEHN